MLDINFIRENAEIIKAAVLKKRVDADVNKLLELDDRRRVLIGELETKKAEQNRVSDLVPQESDITRKTAYIEAMKSLKEEIQSKEEELRPVMEAWRLEMLRIPNIPDMSVPVGSTDSENVEVKKWGEIPEFSFHPKSHIDLMQKLGIADFERGTKVAGFRGYFLKGDGALLEWALWRFVIDELLPKGFELLAAPSMVKKEPFMGTGYLPGGEDDLYKTQDDMYLAGTAEVPTMGYYMDEVLSKDELPKKFLSFSPCYRREAGSHGRDTKGLMRVHEFFKLEQVILCEASHEESVRLHEELLANVEHLMQRLNIPYHVVLNCSGDLGLGQVKKYDLEAWVPSEEKYRETHSCSYFHDFQARRLNIRYTDSEGKKRYVHSLNNTAVATPRILIPLIENNQREDGTIIIPEALQKYMGKAVIE